MFLVSKYTNIKKTRIQKAFTLFNISNISFKSFLKSNLNRHVATEHPAANFKTSLKRQKLTACNGINLYDDRARVAPLMN